MGDIQKVKETGLSLRESDSLALNQRIETLESALIARQVRFAQFMAACPKRNQDAAVSAGYSKVSSSTRAAQLLKNDVVVELIACYRRRDALENGFPASWKRNHLAAMVEDPRTRNSDRNASLKLMAELDGDLKPEGAAATIINVSLPFASPTPVAFTQSDDTESDDIEDAEIIEYPSMGFLDSNKGGEGR